MRVAAGFASLCLLLTVPVAANALPVFAHRYGFSCQVCHTVVPHLNALGESFRDSGFRFAEREPGRAFPIAAKFNLAYASTPDGSGLPKAMLDELELLTGGHMHKNVSYFIEQYVVDGGRTGSTRDAWIAAGNTLNVKVGQFTLPLPVDVEDERDTLVHYAAFDQTVGANTFAFFDPRMGADISVGGANADRATLHVIAADPHDPGSGLARNGLDLMLAAAASDRGLTFSAYRYVGTRPLGRIGDAFWRQGFALGGDAGKLHLDGLLQRGVDTSYDGAGSAAASSAGYVQARWSFSPAIFAVARDDITYDDLSGVKHGFAASIVARPARNMRLTLEGDFGRGSAALRTALLFAY